MDNEDWPDPLPKGWTLKKYSNGKVWAHNKKTGQTFRTKKDLLRYVHYAENVLPFLPINKNVQYEDNQAVSDSKGKAVDDNAGESAKAFDDKEGNSEQPSEGEDGNSEEAHDDDNDDDDDDDSDDSLYGGLDFSRGIWGIKNVEIIERSSSHASVAGADVQNTGSNQQPEGKMKVQVEQLPETETETEAKSKTVTDHRRNKRAGPRKKFVMPPKRFRGSGSRKNHHHKP